MLEKPQKKQNTPNNLFLGRSLIGAFLILVGLIFLIVRLFHLQVIEHELYN